MRCDFGECAILCAAVLFCCLPASSPAQTRGSLAAAGRPSGAKAAADVRPAPRLPEGHINLDAAPGEKGFWNVFRGAPTGTKRPGLPTNLSIDQVPFQVWARDLYKYRKSRNGRDDPHARCVPAGGLRFFEVPNGLNIVQQPDLHRIFLVSGENREWRRIAMEPGRKHPPADELTPSYLGDSIGHWDGDTLVIDSVGYNERFWLSRDGLPHTRYLHLVERLTRVNYNTLKYEFTIDDKGAYTKPWSGGWTISWQTVNYDNSPGGEIAEYFCGDNERDSEHFEQ